MQKERSVFIWQLTDLAERCRKSNGNFLLLFVQNVSGPRCFNCKKNSHADSTWLWTVSRWHCKEKGVSKLRKQCWHIVWDSPSPLCCSISIWCFMWFIILQAGNTLVKQTVLIWLVRRLEFWRKLQDYCIQLKNPTAYPTALSPKPHLQNTGWILLMDSWWSSNQFNWHAFEQLSYSSLSGK